MKKTIVKTFCIFLVCCLLLPIAVGTIMAAEPGYERTSYSTLVPPTIDGVWTSEDEWTDGDITMIGEDVAFRSTWDMDEFVTTRWVVEFFSDTTNDPEDYWQFCIDGDQSGGSAPQSGDFRLDIAGHTTLTVYEGNGTGWEVITPAEGDIEWANSLSGSPTNSTSHWILEFNIVKNTGTVQMGILWNFRLAVYDASNSAAGVLAWPPTDADIPDGWGIENYSSEVIPEGLSFVVLALLSSVVMIVTTLVFRKRSRKQEK